MNKHQTYFLNDLPAVFPLVFLISISNFTCATQDPGFFGIAFSVFPISINGEHTLPGVWAQNLGVTHDCSLSS